MLKQRVITAVLLALPLIASIFASNPLFFQLLLCVLLFLSLTELVNMTVSRQRGVQLLIAVSVVVLFYLSIPLNGIRFAYYYSIAGLFAWIAIPLLMTQYAYSGRWPVVARVTVGLFSVGLIWICLQGLVFLHHHFQQGGWILLYLLTLVWVADIGAYFSGRRFGRHKLAPAISPGKTWEGVLGGLILNVLWISLVFLLSGGWGMGYLMFLLLGLVTSAISVTGDLYESVIKREAGFKDSGNILPGHGGVMDRIDSIIAATPVFVTGLFLLEAV